MIAVKEKIFGAVTIMSNSDAENVWNFIVKQHSPSWDDIEEVEPDAIDIQMLKEIEADPECREFEEDGNIVWN